MTETELQYARKPAARGTPRRRLALIILGVAVVQFVVLAGLAVLMSAPETSDARLAPESTLAVPSPPSHSPLAASIATAAPAAAASTFNEQLARRASAAAAASASAKRQLAQRSAAIGNAAAAATASTTTAATTAVAGGGGNSGELAESEPEALAALEVAFREHLEALQQPADCGAAPLYLFVPHVFASGIGSQLRTVANSMMQARAAPHSLCPALPRRPAPPRRPALPRRLLRASLPPAHRAPLRLRASAGGGGGAHLPPRRRHSAQHLRGPAPVRLARRRPLSRRHPAQSKAAEPRAKKLTSPKRPSLQRPNLTPSPTPAPRQVRPSRLRLPLRARLALLATQRGAGCARDGRLGDLPYISPISPR